MLLLLLHLPACPGNSVLISNKWGASYRFYASSTASIPLPGGNGVQSFTTPTLLSNTSFYVSAVSDSGCESLDRKEVRVILFLRQMSPFDFRTIRWLLIHCWVHTNGISTMWLWLEKQGIF